MHRGTASTTPVDASVYKFGFRIKAKAGASFIGGASQPGARPATDDWSNGMRNAPVLGV